MPLERYLFIEVSMACSDAEAMERFWVELFDARVVFRGLMAGQPFVRLVMPGVSLIFRQDPSFVAPPGPGEEWEYRNHLGVRVDDLDRAIADLESRGAKFVLTPALARRLQQKQQGAMKYLETTYIAPPLTRERITAGEFKHDVAILVGPDNLWVELNQIREPEDTRWYPA
jgi:catechol 2,3-dioxygenase-like lactoylglutathione lyase family enzyme